LAARPARLTRDVRGHCMHACMHALHSPCRVPACALHLQSCMHAPPHAFVAPGGQPLSRSPPVSPGQVSVSSALRLCGGRTKHCDPVVRFSLPPPSPSYQLCSYRTAEPTTRRSWLPFTHSWNADAGAERGVVLYYKAKD
jgi:hypothetical protein